MSNTLNTPNTTNYTSKINTEEANEYIQNNKSRELLKIIACNMVEDMNTFNSNFTVDCNKIYDKNKKAMNDFLKASNEEKKALEQMKNTNSSSRQAKIDMLVNFKKKFYGEM